MASPAGVPGALIADAFFVETPSLSHRIDVVHSAEPDEWCVTVDGERVLSFSGPSAWTKAVSHQAELHELLGRESVNDAVAPPPDQGRRP